MSEAPYDFPYEVKVRPHEWIPLSDGSRLAAKIWLPEHANRYPVPAILEYIPYRKNDIYATRDTPRHHYFAGHGYASVRVDIRGSGDSDGILHDEYLPQEQQDCLEVLQWISRQPWCQGKVGMIGISWGGFNSLQVASYAPPELGAVVSIAASDDRYLDDVHYMGGCVLAGDMLSWSSSMLAFNTLPPDPEVVGPRWRDMWVERMEQTRPWVEPWLSHQRKDAYWRQGSVAQNYSAIECPVYMVGGWADAYRNSILRFLESFPGTAKGLLGPWGHQYPMDGVPGPAIGFLQETIRWWDHWLKGIDMGLMDEPKLRIWMQEAVRPKSFYDQRPGQWIGLDGWPSEAIGEQALMAGGDGALAEGQGTERAELLIQGGRAPVSDPGTWCGHGQPGDTPADQRPADGMALTFETGTLDHQIPILGLPTAQLVVQSAGRSGILAVRLCDVWPDGASTLITRGLLNLTHRNGHEQPEPLEPDRPYRVTIPLTSIAYTLPAGHRLRLAIDSTYWPLAWPTSESPTLTIVAGDDCVLRLPVYTGGGTTGVPEHFDQPESGPPPPNEPVVPSAYMPKRTIERDAASGSVEIIHKPGYHRGKVRLIETGIEYSEEGRDRWSIMDSDPLSARAESSREMSVGRGEWRTRVAITSTMTADIESFHVTNVLEGFEGDRRVFAKTWHATMPRDNA